MTKASHSLIIAAVLTLTACSSDEAPVAPADDVTATAAQAASAVEIKPGLTMRILEHGDGEPARAGQTAVVHYTGWLYDADAVNHRGKKFDSSVDRNQHFRFVLGAGHVIPGWDEGVAGMQVGETRELTIAPGLAYGARGAGDVIPPDATLVFEITLAALEEPAAPQ